MQYFFLQFPQAQIGGKLVDKILLFQHDVQSENILKLLKSAEELKHRDMVEIVLSCKFLQALLAFYFYSA